MFTFDDGWRRTGFQPRRGDRVFISERWIIEWQRHLVGVAIRFGQVGVVLVHLCKVMILELGCQRGPHGTYRAFVPCVGGSPVGRKGSAKISELAAPARKLSVRAALTICGLPQR